MQFAGPRQVALLYTFSSFNVRLIGLCIIIAGWSVYTAIILHLAGSYGMMSNGTNRMAKVSLRVDFRPYQRQTAYS